MQDIFGILNLKYHNLTSVHTVLQSIFINIYYKRVK